MPSHSFPALTLRELNNRITRLLSNTSLQDVWVVAELSDLRTSGGHCYMELIEKQADTGTVTARIRGIIWASVFGKLSAEFISATGQRLATGLKVMMRGTVNYHASFGMSFVISAINPAYTMGEVERRRREILARLQSEGVIDLNKSLEWEQAPLRIAIISAKGAAGYGDFIHQIYTNPYRLRFSTRLFPALLQGENTAPSVISALDAIAAEAEDWDCVVIIRGGGATSDLISFDDYNLASNIAQFPLPVIVGIGHERDITVLDYVANMRVKTPTAAAEWLINRGADALNRLHNICSEILSAASLKIAECQNQLSYCEGLLPIAPRTAMERADNNLTRVLVSLSSIGIRRIAPEFTRLTHTFEAITTAAATQISRNSDRLDAKHKLLNALSPEATLQRGYSITRINGHAARSASEIPTGSTIETTLADGIIISTTIQ